MKYTMKLLQEALEQRHVDLRCWRAHGSSPEGYDGVLHEFSAHQVIELAFLLIRAQKYRQVEVHDYVAKRTLAVHEWSDGFIRSTLPEDYEAPIKPGEPVLPADIFDDIVRDAVSMALKRYSQRIPQATFLLKPQEVVAFLEELPYEAQHIWTDAHFHDDMMEEPTWQKGLQHLLRGAVELRIANEAAETFARAYKEWIQDETPST